MTGERTHRAHRQQGTVCAVCAVCAGDAAPFAEGQGVPRPRCWAGQLPGRATPCWPLLLLAVATQPGLHSPLALSIATTSPAVTFSLAKESIILVPRSYTVSISVVFSVSFPCAG
jgi:hypothetical protein